MAQKVNFGVVALVLAIFFAPTLGANWFVSETGNPANNCNSPQTACAHLSNLVSKPLLANDVIILSGVIKQSAGGQSDQLNVSVSPWNLPLTFQSAAGPAATLLTGSYFFTGSSAPITRSFNNIYFAGATSSAFRISGGSWRFNDCNFANNTATNGGVFTIQDSAVVDLNNCNFGAVDRGANLATGLGGSIYITNATLTMSNCRSNGFGNTTSTRGGLVSLGYGANVRIQGGDHRGHYAEDRGGVISLDPYGAIAAPINISFTNVTFEGNGAAGYGGVLYLDPELRTQNGSITLRDVTCRKNWVEFSGGGCLAMYASHSEGVASWNVTISDSRFQNNRAGDAGGDIASNSPIDIFRSNFSGSTAGYGGNLVLGFNIPRARLFGPIIFSDSYASYDGGCLSMSAAAEFYGTTVFSNCSAGANGGALFSNIGDSKFYGEVVIDRSKAAFGGSAGFKGANAVFYGPVFMRNGTATTGHGGNFVSMCSNVEFNSHTEILGGRALLGNGGNIALMTSDADQVYGGVSLLGDALVDGGRAEAGYGGNIYQSSDPTADYRPSLVLQGTGGLSVRVTNGYALLGGNVYIDKGTQASFTRVLFADSTGPHVWVSSDSVDAQVTIDGSLLIRARNTTNGGAARIEADSTYSDNAVSGNGGALWIQGSATIVNILNNRYLNNSAVDGGAAYFVFASGSDFSNANNNFGSPGTPTSGNRASGRGGAFYSVNKFTSSSNNFFYNRASYGGAFYFESSPTNPSLIEFSNFHNNTASVDGGAGYIRGDVFSLMNSALNNNTAGRNGGAIAYVCTNGAGPCGFLHVLTNYTRNAAATGGAIWISQSGSYGADVIAPLSNMEGNMASIAGGAVAIVSNSTSANNYLFDAGKVGINDAPKGASLYFQGSAAGSRLTVPFSTTQYFVDSRPNFYPLHIDRGYMLVMESVVHPIRLEGSESRLEVQADANVSRIMLSNGAKMQIIDYHILQVVENGHIITGVNCSIVADVEAEIQLLQNTSLNATNSLYANKVAFTNMGGHMNLWLNAPAVGNGVDPANLCLYGPETGEPAITIRNNYGTLGSGRQCILDADIFQGDGSETPAEMFLHPVGTTFVSYSFLLSTNSIIYATLFNATQVSNIKIDSGSVELNGAVVVRSFGSYAPLSSTNYTFLNAWDVMSTSFSSISYAGQIGPGSLLDFSSTQSADTTTLVFNVTILPAPIAPPANPPVNPPVAPPSNPPVSPPVNAPVEILAPAEVPVSANAPSRSLPQNASPTAQSRSNNDNGNGDGTVTTTGSNVGPIVGGIIGAVVLLAIIVGVVVWFVLRKKRRDGGGGSDGKGVWDQHHDDQEMATI